MNKSEILSSAMADAEIEKLETRQKTLNETVTERRSNFENADVETRESILAELEGYKAELESIDTELVELKELRKSLAEQEERTSFGNTLSAENIEGRKKVEERNYNTPEYRHTVAEYLRSGKIDRALGTEEMEVLIKTTLQPYIETAWEEDQNIVDLCDIVSVKNIYAVPVEIAATDAVWHDEYADAPAEEEIYLGSLLMRPKFIKKWLSLTDEVLLMADDMFLPYVGREMAHKVKEQLNNSIINRVPAQGEEDMGVIGVIYDVDNTLTHDDYEIAMGEKLEAELDFNTANRALAKLNTTDCVVVMNRVTFFDNILGMKDLSDRPIYQIMTDNAGRPQYYFNGLRVVFCDVLPAYDNADAEYMIVGNFKGYKLNLPMGRAIQMLRDPYTLAPEDRERMVAKLPAAGRITKRKHFCVVTKNGEASV